MDMMETIESMEDNLKECCLMMLELLDQLREKGAISQKEYEKQIKKKVKFLKYIDSKI